MRKWNPSTALDRPARKFIVSVGLAAACFSQKGAKLIYVNVCTVQLHIMYCATWLVVCLPLCWQLLVYSTLFYINICKCIYCATWFICLSVCFKRGMKTYLNDTCRRKATPLILLLNCLSHFSHLWHSWAVGLLKFRLILLVSRRDWSELNLCLTVMCWRRPAFEAKLLEHLVQTSPHGWLAGT